MLSSRAVGPSRLTPFLALVLAFVRPAAAEAQWYAGAFGGTNYTVPASVTLDQPAASRHLTFSNVRFDAEPFKSPQYYGWRAVRLLGAERTIGVELEFIHMKAIAVTNATYAM